MSQTTADFIYCGQYLLPTSRQQDLIEGGGVAVKDDTIVDIGKKEELISTYPEAKLIHEDHTLIMPGLINTHTHAAMSCFRGLADDLPLMVWLEKHIFPIEAKLTSEIVYRSTLLSIAEMIKSGTTSFCDMYLFSGDVAKAADETGIRAWIGEVLYDFPSPCYGELKKGISYHLEMIKEYKDHPLVSITTDPHSVYTCSPELLVKLGDIANENDTLYVIHLSENDAEVATCRDRYGLRPVEHLQKLGLLGPNTLASHCVKVNDHDIDLLSQNDVKVAHCVESNMKLASGIAPVVKMMQKNITLSIGTDGSASNNDVDMFSEMNSVAKLHKITCMDPTVMNAESTLEAATLGGAKALGQADSLGSLKRGKKADFIVLDLNQPHMIPIYNVPSHLTYVARGGDVLHSFIGGKQVMKDRKLLTIDEGELLHQIREISEKIVLLRN